LWNDPTEKLADYAGFIIVGVFSYEDRGRAGVIAALDPLMQAIKQQSELGKPILGICNGAQILVETGLVPGLEHNQVGMALTDNKRVQRGHVLGTGYYNAWVNMRLSDHYQLNAFTRTLSPKNILHIPVAHGEGRFIIPPALLSEMQNNGQCVFQYCDANGNITDEFPVNPNGSIQNIAAVSNKTGNVMAMMPHPERTTNGDAIFASMREYIELGLSQRVLPMHYQSQHFHAMPYATTHHELLVDLMITDNQALSIENALGHHGMNANVKRYTHWEVACDSLDELEKIKSLGVLFNDRKEKLVRVDDVKKTKHAAILVRAKDDMLGLQKFQMLKNHYDCVTLKALHHSTVWCISGESDDIINSTILLNPYAHDYYNYE
jgi:phosphoribosylformylglycinamidine synthase I